MSHPSASAPCNIPTQRPNADSPTPQRSTGKPPQAPTAPTPSSWTPPRLPSVRSAAQSRPLQRHRHHPPRPLHHRQHRQQPMPRPPPPRHQEAASGRRQQRNSRRGRSCRGRRRRRWSIPRMGGAMREEAGFCEKTRSMGSGLLAVWTKGRDHVLAVGGCLGFGKGKGRFLG